MLFLATHRGVFPSHRGVFHSPSVCPHLQTLLTLLWSVAQHPACNSPSSVNKNYVNYWVGKVTNGAMADKSHGIFLFLTGSASLLWWRKQ